MNPLQLDEVVQQIEHAFGAELPVGDPQPSGSDREVLSRIMQTEAYQAYLQDQVNRQIIRDYLLNAIMLGCITEENLVALCRQAGSSEGRSSLSLYMLMSSVDAANDISRQMHLEELKALRPAPGSPPHMVIVGS